MSFIHFFLAIFSVQMVFISTYIHKHAVFIGISAHGRLNFKGLFLAHKHPWPLIWVGA